MGGGGGIMVGSVAGVEVRDGDSCDGGPGVLRRVDTAEGDIVDDLERREIFLVKGIVSGSTVTLDSNSDSFEAMRS